MITANGVLFNPHKQNGYLRHFNLLEHKQVGREFDGFILVDVTKMPKITYSHIDKEFVDEDSPHYERDTALGLFTQFCD
jgi:hypothetical protein